MALISSCFTSALTAAEHQVVAPDGGVKADFMNSDSPANYRGQPGVEFFRNLPTVWDETVVLNAEVGKSIVT